MPKIGQAVVLLGRTGPARMAEDYFPTVVANNVLGGGYSARLNAEIRIKRGLSYGANSGVTARKQPGRSPRWRRRAMTRCRKWST